MHPNDPDNVWLPGEEDAERDADMDARNEAHAAFGDVVENGWASEDNPTRRGYFVRAFKRTGRMNPGLTWEITDGNGKFWELQPRVIGDRLTVSPKAEHGDAAKQVEIAFAMYEALQFYADPANWQDFIARPQGRDSHYHSAHAHLDKGERARAALAKAEGK